MKFIKVTGHITEEPVWVNPDYIVRIQRGRDEGGKILIACGSETMTLFTVETADEIAALVMEGGEMPECSST